MFVLLGSHGQVTAQLARLLLGQGRPVRVIGRNAAGLAPLAQAGAEVVVGSPADAGFLAEAFAGATAAYTMIPPCYGEPLMRAAQDRIGQATAQALARAGVARVVNLSSIGAELPAGTGPIAGLHAQEKRLDALAGIDVLHLRPGSFMENFLAVAQTVAEAGILPGMEAPDAAIPMVATRDVAAVAARELAAPTRSGVLVLHAPSPLTMRAAAAVLGSAIGRPGLPYIQTEPVEAKAQLRALGFSADAADQIEALARWLSTSPLDSVSAAPVEVQPTSLDAFARDVFAPACVAR